MIDSVLDTLTNFKNILWGPWTLILIASVAVYFNIRARFFQVVRFPYILKQTLGRLFDRPKREDPHAMTPFQATSTALAGTVGMGNMAGVATALSLGGPGAIFWMWVLAFLGMMTKTAEITIAVHYREIDENGHIHGGPMHYIQKGLGWTFLAYLFAAGMLINAVFSSSMLQSHTVGRAFLSSYGTSPYFTTTMMALVTAMVVLGGVRRIGRFSEVMVPFMSVVYIICGLGLVIVNRDQIPGVLQSIIQYAFSPAPAVGGAAGVTVIAAIRNGVSKGMLSNEAGLGTAPMVHATTNAAHPFQQGMWGALEVFVDTIVVCSITAFAILSTGVLGAGVSGIDLVIDAFSAVYPETTAQTMISIAILTFSLSTQIGFYIYYETSIDKLFGKKAIGYLKWLYFLPGVVFAGFANVDKLWVVADISVGVVAIPNLIALLFLGGVFVKLMKDYLSHDFHYGTAAIDASKRYIKSPRHANACTSPHDNAGMKR
jgi:AGCS family alanine or glycine:cation symporter